MNLVVLTGNLGVDPVDRSKDGSETKIAEFTLATEERYRDKQGEVHKDTSWHRCKVFSRLAETMLQHCKKGSKITITGSIKYGNYEKDGVKHYTTDIIVKTFEFVGGPKDETPAEPRAAQIPQGAAQRPQPIQPDDDNDLPF